MNSTETSVFTATEADFETSVVAASKDRLVLVDFWAQWCGPCKALGPILEQVAQERSDSLKVVKVDVDAEQRLAQNHGVRALPTLVVFHEGRAVSQLVGLQSAESIKEALDRVSSS
ncbi:MAG: thioredoxin [Synoicihabitans sp.]